MMFPYIEQPALWDIWSKDFSAAIPTIEADNPQMPEIIGAQCPSDAPDGPGTPALSYVVNAGQAFQDSTRVNSSTSGQSVTNTEYIGNGVFFDINRNPNFNSSRLDGREKNDHPTVQSSINYVSSSDGTSKTFMVTENINAINWSYLGDTTTWSDAKHHFGFVWHTDVSAGNGKEIRRVNGATQVDPDTVKSTFWDAAGERYGYPASNHPGGVNISFCDTHIVFIAEDIDPRVYAQSMTSNRKRSKYYDVTQGNKSDKDLPQPSDSDL